MIAHGILRYGFVFTAVGTVVADADAAFPFLDDGYCASSHAEAFDGSIDIASMDCAEIMEFVYISRWKLWQQLDQELAEVNQSSVAASSLKILRRSSKASSLASAHVHIITAVASQRSECFSEHVRLLLTVSLRRMKTLCTQQVKQLWFASQDGFTHESDHQMRLKSWLSEATGLLEADLRTLKTVLQTWTAPSLAESRFYSHEADGRYSTMEALRRDTFEEYQLDKGLLQGMLRMLPLDAVVADFGAGSGQYSKWLNDTGLVTALAFDGSPDIHLVTKGAVALADLGQPLSLWRRFDWSLCIEVAEHLPTKLTPTFLANLDKHTEQGLIITWARPGLQGLGTANPLTQDQALELIREHTGLSHLDQELTAALRASASIPHIADTLLVMVRPGSAGAAPTSDAAPACNAEHGWIYAGNDVQMFTAVKSASACCELCNSNENCRFWTWSREESHKEFCWIKATREYRISHAGFISGTRDSDAALANLVSLVSPRPWQNALASLKSCLEEENQRGDTPGGSSSVRSTEWLRVRLSSSTTMGPVAQFNVHKKKMCKRAIAGSSDWKDKEDKTVEAFQSWDTDGNGFIGEEELADVLAKMGCEVSSKDLQIMLKNADGNKDGKIAYEEMVHWICRAPDLEVYFMLSSDLFKESVKQLEQELQILKRSLESQEDAQELMNQKLTMLQTTAKAKMQEKLTPVIKRSFSYHDKDNSGALTYDESMIFFSNFVALYEPFMETISKLSTFQRMTVPSTSTAAPHELHNEFLKQYTILKDHHLENIDSHHKAAFECLCREGQIREDDLVEALLHGHPKNREFLEALGLLATLGDMESKLQDKGETLAKIEQSATIIDEGFVDCSIL
ncbi:unnamed protein product [Durusdinium trenchii]|uniref:Uncharacterized protein n=2 Tax=Durusdinium trenchii TaxID=1381693 RepID=A0ABP0HA82_9DINO